MVRDRGDVAWEREQAKGRALGKKVESELQAVFVKFKQYADKTPAQLDAAILKKIAVSMVRNINMYIAICRHNAKPVDPYTKSMRNYWRTVYNRRGKVPSGRKYLGLVKDADAAEFNNKKLSAQFAHLIAKEEGLGTYIVPEGKEFH